MPANSRWDLILGLKV